MIKCISFTPHNSLFFMKTAWKLFRVAVLVSLCNLNTPALGQAQGLQMPSHKELLIRAESDHAYRLLRRKKFFNIFSAITLVGLGGTMLFMTRNYRRARATQRLKELKSMMSPHYCANAIAGAGQYLNLENPEGPQYLSECVRLFRDLAKANEQLYVPLVEEIQMLQHFTDMSIKGVNVTYAIDPELHKLNPEIPTALLQPILENACLHGMSGLKKGNSITVSADHHAGLIRISVTDNGGGFDPALPPTRGESMALQNIREQIALHNKTSKKKVALDINSAPGQGTVVTLTVKSH